MTIHSMTGFGAAKSSHDGWAMTVELRSVNHRGLDVRVWAPRHWSWIEPYALELVRGALARGRVEVRVDVAPQDGATDVGLDTELFHAVAKKLQDAAEKAGLPNVTAADVLMFEQVRSASGQQQPPQDEAPFRATIADAVAQLAASRAAEGARLLGTFVELTDEVARCVTEIESAAPAVNEEYRSRLEQRVADALARFEIGELDERTILHEVAVYADRSDISEELQRTKSHLVKLREIFTRTEHQPTGKQVDFYLQELFREANTTGSKSGSIAITDHVIAMKTANEKMREQAANVE